MMSVRYVPGSRFAIVAPERIVVFAIDAEADAVRAVAEALAAGAPVQDMPAVDAVLRANGAWQVLGSAGMPTSITAAEVELGEFDDARAVPAADAAITFSALRAVLQTRIRSEAPTKRLITGPPAASGQVPIAETRTHRPDDPAEVDTLTSQTDTLTAGVDTFTAETDDLDADTKTEAGEVPVVARAADDSGQKVLTRLCEADHVQRAGAPSCRICGTTLRSDTEAMRPRPEFAAAVLPNGERIELGRGIVFGRRPRSNRMQGVRVPKLVALESPGEDISRSHLELRLEGWSMLATDLGSTNGTMLLRDDREPQRLRAGVAVHVEFGDRLDVGDGVVIALEEL